MRGGRLRRARRALERARSERPTAIAPVKKETAIVPAEELVRRARAYAEEARAPNTRRAYASQWQKFEAWCAAREFESLPAAPAVVALYLTERADGGAGVSTLEQALAAIARRHELARLASPHRDPELREVWSGIRRARRRPPRRASAVGPEALRRMIRSLKPGLAATRDAALLLLAFAGALRRDEAVGVDVEHLSFGEDGLSLSLPHSKTDQEGQGAVVGIPFGSDRATCPVRAMRAWLEASGIEAGAIFRGVSRGGKVSGKRLHGRDVARVLQRAARAAGIELKNLSGHSLRAGLGTTAARQGKRLEVIQRHMRHKRLDQTLEYVREARRFDEDENAASGIGL